MDKGFVMLSILIPAYNEAASIQQTIERVRQAMTRTSVVFEIVVIDDGSRDETARLAEETRVRVIRHPVNRGYGRALKTGMFHATYDWCAIVDADASYPVERLPDLLAHIPRFDMVVGARTGRHYWGSLVKRLGRIFLLALVDYVVGMRVPDVNSGMRIFRKEIALAHLQRISSGFSFTTTLTLAMLLDEHFVKYLPIDYFSRSGKSKVKMGIDSLRMLQILTQAVLFYNPLKLFLPFCVLSLVVGLVVLLIASYFGLGTAGFYFFGISILVAILLGAIGFLAEAIRLGKPSNLKAQTFRLPEEKGNPTIQGVGLPGERKTE